jgi:hypothetical protein
METMHGWLSPAPRNILLLIKIRMLLGGMVNFFGWMFLFLGLFMIWIFEIPAVINSLYEFSGELVSANGTVLSYQRTSVSENNRCVYEMQYIFLAAEGEQYSGKSYAAGEYYKADDVVEIEYKKDNPLYSRISGMRSTSMDAWILFTLLFPLAGLVAVIIGLSIGLKLIHLLKNGEMTNGKFVKREQTSMRVNNRPVIKFTYEFTAKDGMLHQVSAKTHLWEDFEDESQEKVLYDANNPNKAVLIDNLPAKLTLGTDGSFQFLGTSGSFFAMLNLLFPLLTVFIAALMITG